MSSGRTGSGRGLATLRLVGPGIVVAATGVGAGDLVAAAKAGATYGLPLLWAVVIGAGLKLALAEGIARWQLATGTTLLEGWFSSFGRGVRVYFMAYLVIWTVVVAAALMSACGLAAHALFPFLSVRAWAALHGLGALALVWTEGYPIVERVMKLAIGVMFVAIVGSAVAAPPPAGEMITGLLLPRVPSGGALVTAGVIGGVGGSVTLLSYSYWIREKGWEGIGWLTVARVDLSVAYGLTALFGAALLSLGATVLLPAGVVIEGNSGAMQMAAMLGVRFGRLGELIFLLGFWAAVATSIAGVWQGVPYIFADAAARMRLKSSPNAVLGPTVRAPLYRGYLLFLTFPPMVLLLLDRPVWMVVAYAALGSLFMPFLAVTLVILNNRVRHVGPHTNSLLANLAMISCLLLFGYLAVVELAGLLGS